MLLSAQISELRLELRDKEVKIRDMEREQLLKIKELNMELERAREEVRLRDLEIR